MMMEVENPIHTQVDYTRTIKVDEGMKEIVDWFDRCNGVLTIASCQGEEGEEAYILFELHTLDTYSWLYNFLVHLETRGINLKIEVTHMDSGLNFTIRFDKYRFNELKDKIINRTLEPFGG